MASAYNNIPNSTRRPKDVKYFYISSVKRSINSSGLQCFNTLKKKRCFTDCIHVFYPTTNAEITAICGTTDKTCVLDHLPPNQLRDNITSIVSVITMITNTSPDEAVMPRPLKHAIVSPSLKTPSLDKDILSNYQPVWK